MTADMTTKFLAIIVSVGLTFLTGKAQTVDTVLTVSQNPFVISTDLTVHNLTNDTVTFKVYNTLGQVVADFFDSLVLSGTFTVTFTADSLPDGIYFATLTKNSENHSLKLVKDQNATNLTGIQNGLTTIQVYPNPTSDWLTVSTDLNIAGLELYDSNGRQLLLTTSGRERTVDLKIFDAGLYLLHLKTNDRTYIEKIIKK